MSSRDWYRGGGEEIDEMEDADDDDDPRFFRQDLRMGGVLIGLTDGVGGAGFDLDDAIKRTTSSSGRRSGRGTLFSFGARGVPEPAEAFDFFRDMIVRS